MKKPSPLKLFAFVTLIIFAGLAIYPSMIWWEWKREQRIIDSVATAHPSGSNFVYNWPDEYFFMILRWPDMQSIPRIFDRCTGIDFRKSSVSDDDLAAMSGLKNVDQVILGSGFEDRGLAYLADLPALKSLNLYNNTNYTGKGFQPFSTHRTLNEIKLVGSQLSPEGFSHIANIPSLKILALEDPAFSDQDLAEFKDSPIEKLLLGETALSLDGIEDYITNKTPALEMLALQKLNYSDLEQLAEAFKPLGYQYDDADPVYWVFTLR